MAKKRKPKNKPVETITSKGTQSIGYQGRLKVSIQRGNKTISSKEYHNNGMPNLFKFLAYAIAGSYSEVLRPVKIKLFRFEQAESTTQPLPLENFKWSTAWEDEAPPLGISPYILYDVAPVTLKVKNNPTASDPTADDYHYETTFHFRVPFSYLSDTKIHAVGFYPNNAISEANDVSAYYLFTNEDGTEWEPLPLDDVGGNFSLIIEWTMSISNK